MGQDQADTRDDRPPVHATNAWNPTGATLRPVPGCRLYAAHVQRLGAVRTVVFLGSQRHLTFVADLEGHLPFDSLRERVLLEGKLYPHLVDLDPPPGFPRPVEVRADG